MVSRASWSIGLDEVVVEPDEPAAGVVLLLSVTRYRHDHRLPAVLLLAEPPRHFVAVHLRQADIQQDEFRALFSRDSEASLPLWAVWTSWPRIVSSRAMPCGRVHVVIHHEDSRRSPERRFRVSLEPGPGFRRALGRREPHGEFASIAQALAPGRDTRRRAARPAS